MKVLLLHTNTHLNKLKQTNSHPKNFHDLARQRSVCFFLLTVKNEKQSRKTKVVSLMHARFALLEIRILGLLRILTAVQMSLLQIWNLYW